MTVIHFWLFKHHRTLNNTIEMHLITLLSLNKTSQNIFFLAFIVSLIIEKLLNSLITRVYQSNIDILTFSSKEPSLVPSFEKIFFSEMPKRKFFTLWLNFAKLF